MTSLSNNLSSTNVVVKNKADVLVDLIVDTVENVYLIQPLVHLSIYGNTRSKPAILLHLNGKLNKKKLTCLDIVPDVFKIKSSLISKHVIPAVFKLVDENKTDVKCVVNKLVNTLYKIMGSSLLDMVPSNKVPKLLDIINSG
jgi:hypothetical protein